MSKRILKIYQSVAYSKSDVPYIMLRGIGCGGVVLKKVAIEVSW